LSGQVLPPARWTDAAILESTLRAGTGRARDTRGASLAIDGTTLHHFEGFRFSVFPTRRTPHPNWKTATRWNGWGVSSGASTPSAHQELSASPHVEDRNFGTEPRDYLLAHDFMSGRPSMQPTAAFAAGAGWLCATVSTGGRGEASCGSRRLPCRHVLWTDDGPHFVDFDDSRMGPPCRICGCCSPVNARTACRQMGDVLAGYEDFYEFDAPANCTSSKAAHPAPDPLLRWLADAGTMPPSSKHSRGSHPALLARSHPRITASRLP